MSSVERISRRDAGLERDKGAGALGAIFRLDWTIAFRDGGHDDRTLGGREKVVSEADEGGGGDFVSKASRAG